MTKSLWTVGLPSMMKLAGKNCRAYINGGMISFTGILDSAEITEQGDLGSFTRMDSVLRIDKATAMILKDVVNQEITIDNIKYVINEPIFEDDGETAICPIYPYDTEKRV